MEGEVDEIMWRRVLGFPYQQQGGCQWGLKRMEEVQRSLEGEQFEVPKVSFYNWQQGV